MADRAAVDRERRHAVNLADPRAGVAIKRQAIMKTRRSHPADEGRLMPPVWLRRHSPSKATAVSRRHTLPAERASRRAMKAGDLLIDENEIVESFVRSSGPGGQNVNKVASAVELRFDARRSPSLPNHANPGSSSSLGRAPLRMACYGHFRPELRQSAPQSRRRASTAHGFAHEGAGAAKAAPLATRPTTASRVRRVDDKTRRGAVKALRGKAQRWIDPIRCAAAFGWSRHREDPKRRGDPGVVEITRCPRIASPRVPKPGGRNDDCSSA